MSMPLHRGNVLLLYKQCLRASESQLRYTDKLFFRRRLREEFTAELPPPSADAPHPLLDKLSQGKIFLEGPPILGGLM
jgi:Complex 1 protein (LYR family)